MLRDIALDMMKTAVCEAIYHECQDKSSPYYNLINYPKEEVLSFTDDEFSKLGLYIEEMIPTSSVEEALISVEKRLDGRATLEELEEDIEDFGYLYAMDILGLGSDFWKNESVGYALDKREVDPRELRKYFPLDVLESDAQDAARSLLNTYSQQKQSWHSPENSIH
jgi:hypothetical protein